MKKRFGFNLLFLAVAMTLLACGSKMNSANLEKIHNDMTTAEVKDVLGSPTEENTGGMGPLSGTTYVYKSGKSQVTINFVNGKVVMKSGSFDN